MINQVSEYIYKEQLFKKTNKLLIGLSGGRDSISLALVLKELGYQTGIAHCNFSLRGDESDIDETFVIDFAKKEQLEYFHTKFNTQKYAKEKGVSIQMAARELRYNWFEEIRKENKYDYILIAHNRDDIIETFFINLIRGTGIEGLTGIKSKNNKIVRPLLNTSRININEYINKNNIKYREDSSNASTKYIRNKLRHNILPEIRSISSVFDQSMVENIERINHANQVYKNEINSKKQKILIQLPEFTRINISHLKQLNPVSTYLFEFLKPYGFGVSTIKDIELSLDSKSGKKFYSKTHQLIKDRENLILSLIHKSQKTSFFFGEDIRSLKKPISLDIKIIDNNNYKIERSQYIAALDFDKLKFPLQIKLWEHGDFFMPLGMNRMKKLSDFFIDSKISLTEKERTYIIQSKNDIVWIVGKRIDDRYKITNQTKKIFLITYILDK